MDLGCCGLSGPACRVKLLRRSKVPVSHDDHQGLGGCTCVHQASRHAPALLIMLPLPLFNPLILQILLVSLELLGNQKSYQSAVDDPACLSQAQEQLTIEKLITKPAVEALHVAVLPGVTNVRNLACVERSRVRGLCGLRCRSIAIQRNSKPGRQCAGSGRICTAYPWRMGAR